MGSALSNTPFIYKTKTTPDYDQDPTFPSEFGFEGERKERVMKATKADLVSARIPPQYRDYCAHHYINYMACKNDKAPFVHRCHHERHTLMECQYEDSILRMKEFERERRLLERKDRKERKEKLLKDHADRLPC